MVFRGNFSLLVFTSVSFSANQLENFVFLYALRANFKHKDYLLTSRVSIPKYDSESEYEVY